MEMIVLIVLRLLTAGILAAGSVWMASMGRDEWGWLLIGACYLAAMDVSEIEKKQ